MRALRILCLCAILLHAIFAIDYRRGSNYISSENLQWKSRDELDAQIGSMHQAVLESLSRNKREDNLEEEDAFPARHVRHRHRRRCKNRPLCSRDVTTIGENQRMVTSKILDSEEDSKDIKDGSARIPLGPDDDFVTMSNPQIDETEFSSISELMDRRELSDTKVDNIEVYDDRPLPDEYEFGDTNASSWMNAPSMESDEVVNENSRSSAYMPIDDQVAIHESLATLLTRLFQILRNTSIEDSQDLLRELNFVDDMNEDPCQRWLNSQDKLEEAFLGPLVSLPACPCQYPSNIFYDDKIWDKAQRKHFRWRDVSGESQRLDVYKPGASYCVRSLLTQGTGSAAAQHCCYDRKRKLLNRGSGAGTPNFVSPEISAVLHEKIDILPWRLCKGDFSRFNRVRPPNNGNGCESNPDDEEYQRQMDNTKYY